MAKKFLTNIDLGNNQLLNVAVQQLASDPTTPVEGQIWENTTTHHVKIYLNGIVTTLDNQGGSYTLPAATTTTLGGVEVSVAPATAATPIAVGTNDPSYTDAVAKKHAQNTDTGTTQTSFQLDSGNTGPRWKNETGIMAARNAGDTAYADAKINNLTVEGNITVNGELETVTGNIINTGDRYVELNNDITAASQNATAGYKNKAFAADNTTRLDGVHEYNPTTGRHQVTAYPNAATATAVQTNVALYLGFDVGNGTATSITLTHNLNNSYPIVQVLRKAAPFDQVECDVTITDANNVVVAFAVAPSAAQYRAIIVG